MEIPPLNTPSYSFININPGEDVKPSDDETRMLIRKSAMRNVTHSKRKLPRNPRFELALNSSLFADVRSSSGLFSVQPFIEGSDFAANSETSATSISLDSGNVMNISTGDFLLPSHQAEFGDNSLKGLPNTPTNHSGEREQQSPLKYRKNHASVLIADPGRGRKNPFVSYPVPMTLKMHELIDHCISLQIFPRILRS